MLLNVNPATVLNYMRHRNLPAMQVDRGLRKEFEFEFEDVREFAERNLLAFNFIKYLELYNPVVESDPLFEAIVSYLNGNEYRKLVDLSTTELVQALTEAGAELGLLGGGKAIAHHLREIRTKLAASNIVLTERVILQRPKFTLQLKE